MIANIFLIITAVLALASAFCYKKHTDKCIKIQKELIESLEERTKKHIEWHNTTRADAIRLCLSEACLTKALEDINTNQNGKGMLYAERWLDKRQEILNEIKTELEKPDLDYASLYQSALDISLMIFKGELDINRD